MNTRRRRWDRRGSPPATWGIIPPCGLESIAAKWGGRLQNRLVKGTIPALFSLALSLVGVGQAGGLRRRQVLVVARLAKGRFLPRSERTVCEAAGFGSSIRCTFKSVTMTSDMVSDSHRLVDLLQKLPLQVVDARVIEIAAVGLEGVLRPIPGCGPCGRSIASEPRGRAAPAGRRARRNPPGRSGRPRTGRPRSDRRPAEAPGWPAVPPGAGTAGRRRSRTVQGQRQTDDQQQPLQRNGAWKRTKFSGSCGRRSGRFRIFFRLFGWFFRHRIVPPIGAKQQTRPVRGP